MRYIDSSARVVEQTVAHWMKQTVDAGIKEFRCQAGYFTLEGSGLLLPALKECAATGATVRVLVGSNGSVTVASHVAFVAGTLGVPQKNVSLGVVTFASSLFHPKTYHFVRKDGSKTAYVGSANLTGPAISGLNIEAGVILDTNESDPASVLDRISGTVDQWFARGLPGLFIVSNASDVDTLIASGILAVVPAQSEREAIEREIKDDALRTRTARHRLAPIFALPAIETPVEEPRSLRRVRTRIEERRFLRLTEASFHYPQGTHLGHILAILYYFSGDRTGTPFDNEYIRLAGSLGSGRIAHYRRQIKYKLLAAMELGLLEDIRLTEDADGYVPRISEEGTRFWALIGGFLDRSVLLFQEDEEGGFSSKMPESPVFYNSLIHDACAVSDALRNFVFGIFLNMPAVKQMLQLIYYQERTRTVQKARIYETFFDFDPVKRFCDAMGIEPGTLEAARHRCPLLLNILDSCGVVSQDTSSIHVEKLAISAPLLIAEGEDESAGARRYEAIVKGWASGKFTISEDDANGLRDLFGERFLTPRYYLRELMQIPA